MGNQSPILSAIRPGIAALPESEIVKVADYGRGRPGLIPLWFGEGDLPTPDFVGDAAFRAMKEGETFYTWQRGIPPLRQALTDYLNATYGTALSDDRITVTSGGMPAIMTVMQTLVDPGDAVSVVTPVWPNIFAAVGVMGGRAVQVPLSFGNAGWQLDLDRLFDSVTPRTRALFINTPTNPTGWIMSREEMLAVRDFARARGLWIVADEVYGRLVYDRDVAPSFLQVTELEDRLVVVNTFSKNWSMTGWRIGWVVAPAPLGAVLENLVQYSTSGTATFLQYGAAAALREGEPYVRAVVERARNARDLVCDRLGALPRLQVPRPEGAFYLFFAVEGETDSLALAYRLIDEAAVGLAPGSGFGDAGQGWLRLCFAGSLDRLNQALDRLVPILA